MNDKKFNFFHYMSVLNRGLLQVLTTSAGLKAVFYSEQNHR